MLNLNDVITLRNNNDYQRDNFDSFLKHIKFSNNIPAIHIAGSNGKGSTAIYLANVYKSGNYKVGLFTSPYFYEVNESIKVNDTEINDDEIKEIIHQYKKEIIKFQLSPFELLTFVAFIHFRKNNCDLLIIECGMGGEYDATNIFDPILSIITSIDIEHTEYLGRSISEIALHKAGIIKDHRPVLIGELPEDAESVIIQKCQNSKSKIYKISPYSNFQYTNNGISFSYNGYDNINLYSFARYEATNASFALETVDILKEYLPIKKEDVLKGLLDSQIPCRFEIISSNPLVILDGAHNKEATEILAKNVLEFSKGLQIHVILACFQDKNLIAMLSNLGAITDDLTLTTFPHNRARKEEDFFLFLDEYRFEKDAISLIKQKMEENPEDIILATGSLAFTSYIRKNLR